MIALRSILGLSGVRVHRTSASQWCKKHGIPTFWQDAKGGKAEFVHLSDLPEDVRLAYVRRECEAAGLVTGHL